MPLPATAVFTNFLSNLSQRWLLGSGDRIELPKCVETNTSAATTTEGGYAIGCDKGPLVVCQAGPVCRQA